MPATHLLSIWTQLAPGQQSAVVEAIVQILTEEVDNERIDQDRRHAPPTADRIAWPSCPRPSTPFGLGVKAEQQPAHLDRVDEAVVNGNAGDDSSEVDVTGLAEQIPLFLLTSIRGT
jgi:hypothetical protein